MPQKEHLPSVSAKEQRMYEHVKESEEDQGRSSERAKAIAAATVVKHHNKARPQTQAVSRPLWYARSAAPRSERRPQGCDLRPLQRHLGPKARQLVGDRPGRRDGDRPR